MCPGDCGDLKNCAYEKADGTWDTTICKDVIERMTKEKSHCLDNFYCWWRHYEQPSSFNCTDKCPPTCKT